MEYLETRRHELRKRRILMVDGNLTLNSQTTDGGASARVYQGGYWGFAASNGTGAADIGRLTTQAARNAAAMGGFGPRATQPLPGGSYRGEHAFAGRPALNQRECVDCLAALHAWCRERYPDLTSTRFHHGRRARPGAGRDDDLGQHGADAA